MPEYTNEQNGHTIAVTRKGKKVVPNTDKTLTPDEIQEGLNSLMDDMFGKL
jgi:hypothetical protein